jgi:hypothetical protein
LTLTCPVGWYIYNSYCFQISGLQTTWDQAQTKCEDAGGFLAEVLDDATNDFILKSVNKGNAQSAYLAYSIDGGKVVNLMGQEATYTNFKSDADLSKGCVVQIRDSSSSNVGKWKTEVCSTARTFVCQRYAM